MSTLPHPETLVLVPCPALPPSPSFVPEPVALPRCELGKGGQDRTGEVSPVVSNMTQSLLQASTPALKKAWDVLKIATCPSVTPSVVLFIRVGSVCAPWAELPGLAEGGHGSGVGRQVPGAGLFPWSWPGAAERSAQAIGVFEKGTDSGA